MSGSMDGKLLTWGRAVKARTGARLPTLWLFTDTLRGGDPIKAARRLPKGLAGVVFRHDGASNRAALGRELARICRARRLSLVVAGDARLAAALGVGMHLRGGRWPAPLRPRGLTTSSAHGVIELHRARRAGADIIFLSPTFSTKSHPGAPELGPARWARLARTAGEALIFALGGINGANVRRLPRPQCAGVGAIGALGG